jgi:hypothetical protein
VEEVDNDKIEEKELHEIPQGVPLSPKRKADAYATKSSVSTS